MSPQLIMKIAAAVLFGAIGIVIPTIFGYIFLTRAGRESLRMGVSNLRRSPLRTSLTMIGIVIGVGAVVAVISMGDGAKKMVADEVTRTGGITIIEVYRDEWDKQGGSTITSRTRRRHFGRWQRNRAKPINYEDYENLAMMLTRVEAICAEDDFGRGIIFQYGDQEKDSGLYGTTTQFPEVYNWHVAKGRFFTDEELEQADKVVVLGSQIAEDLFGDADPIGKEIRAHRVWGRNRESLRWLVVGVMEPKGASASTEGWDDRVMLPLTSFHARVAGHDEVERIRVKATTVEDVPYVIEQIKSILARRHEDPNAFEYWTATEEIATAERLGSILKLLMGVIAGIALVVAGIGIMNIMLVSVTERTKEIGLRKALGAKRRDILFQFLIETAVLTLVGGLLGTTLGVGLGATAARLLERFVLSGSTWPAVMSPVAAGVAVGIAFVIGIVSGVYPASRAAKLTPVEALRTD